jgi:hypothetical protein
MVPSSSLFDRLLDLILIDLLSIDNHNHNNNAAAAVAQSLLLLLFLLSQSECHRNILDEKMKEKRSVGRSVGGSSANVKERCKLIPRAARRKARTPYRVSKVDGKNPFERRSVTCSASVQSRVFHLMNHH